MAEITLFITDRSETCTRVRHLFDARGLPYTTVNIESEADKAELFERTGRMQCPLVMVGDELIGGLRETVEAERSGRLAELVAQ